MQCHRTGPSHSDPGPAEVRRGPRRTETHGQPTARREPEPSGTAPKLRRARTRLSGGTWGLTGVSPELLRAQPRDARHVQGVGNPGPPCYLLPRTLNSSRSLLQILVLASEGRRSTKTPSSSPENLCLSNQSDRTALEICLV